MNVSGPPNTQASSPILGTSGQLVGWAAVEKAVRESDEQLVNDCKEDIDTLLTFVSSLLHLGDDIFMPYYAVL